MWTNAYNAHAQLIQFTDQHKMATTVIWANYRPDESWNGTFHIWQL